MPSNDLAPALARVLWASFEYGLPVSPISMANFIVRQIDLAGYEITKRGVPNE